MDSENISTLLSKYNQGLISPEDEAILMDYLQNNPSIVSEEGYDMLADKLVYEHSLLERKALFHEMMKNQPPSFLKKYLWTILISGVVLLSGTAVVFLNGTKPLAPDAKKENIFVSMSNSLPIISNKDSNVIHNKITDVETSKSVQSTSILNSKFANDLPSNLQNKSNVSEGNHNEISTKNENIAKVISTQNTVVTENKQDVQKQNATASLCPDYSKVVTIKTTKSETNLNNGNIVVVSLKANLEYSIDNENFSNEKSFEHLASGNYNLYIKDNANCSNTITGITIAETTCISNYKKDIAKGQIWQIPIFETEVKSVVIYNSAGQVVFSKLQGFTEFFEWEGVNSQGTELVDGFYKVVVTNQTETCIFNVSILK
jgi:hypothetical protein